MPLLMGTCGPSACVGMRECDKLTGRVSPRTGGESFRPNGAAGSGGVAAGSDSGGRWLVLAWTGAGSAK